MKTKFPLSFPITALPFAGERFEIFGGFTSETVRYLTTSSPTIPFLSVQLTFTTILLVSERALNDHAL